MAAAADAAGVDDPLRHDGQRGRAGRASGSREVTAADGRAGPGRRRRPQRPTCPRHRELLGRPVPAVRRRPATPPAASSCRPGCDSTYPDDAAPHHGLRPRVVRGRSRTSSGPAHARPVVPRVPALADRPGLAPDGRSAAYVLFPTPNLDAGRSTGTRVRGPYREHMLGTHRGRGLDGFGDAIDAEELITPAGLGRPRAWRRARRSRRRTRSARPGRSGRRTPSGDNVVFAGSGTVPGVGRADGAGQRPAGRRARDGQGPGLPLPSLAMSAATPRRWTAAYEHCRLHPRRARAAPTTWPRGCCRAPGARTCGRSTPSPGSPTSSSTTSTRPTPTPCVTWSRTAMTVLAPRRPRRPAVTRCWRRPGTPCATSA